MSIKQLGLITAVGIAMAQALALDSPSLRQTPPFRERSVMRSEKRKADKYQRRLAAGKPLFRV